MAIRALLVTRDDQAVETIVPILAGFGLLMQCCAYSDAVCIVTEQKFAAVLVDFDDPHSAAVVLQNASGTFLETQPVTVALLRDKTRVRDAFGAGANFVLYKPLSPEQVEATLAAATSLIKRERRNSNRIPVQVPVKLYVENGGEQTEVEGILLDFSENGMDVLAAQPLYTSARLHARLTLPDSPSELEIAGEVAWANPNGESGIRFVRLPESLQAALRCWIVDHSREAAAPESEALRNCKLTDLSLGACYVETASPFPERTNVVLTLRADGVELHTQGKVLVMHPSRGMGIQFGARTEGERSHTENFIQFLTSRPGVAPELLISPAAHDGGDDFEVFPEPFEDPLVDLLRSHESFSEETFLEELRKQRGAEIVQR